MGIDLGDIFPTYDIGGTVDKISGGGKVPGSKYDDALALLSTLNYWETKPLRDKLLGTYEDIFSGDFSYEDLPMFTPLFAGGKKSIEDQYNIARGNVLSDMPRGGTMERGLMDVEMGRAESAADLPTMLAQGLVGQMVGQAQPSAFGAPATAISGLGTAAAGESNRNIAEYQTQQGAMQGLGQLLVLLAMT